MQTHLYWYDKSLGICCGKLLWLQNKSFLCGSCHSRNHLILTSSTLQLLNEDHKTIDLNQIFVNFSNFLNSQPWIADEDEDGNVTCIQNNQLSQLFHVVHMMLYKKILTHCRIQKANIPNFKFLYLSLSLYLSVALPIINHGTNLRQA